MKIYIKLEEKVIRRLIYEELETLLGNATIKDISAVRIEVKSKQNYKAEWESADIRAIYEKSE